MCTHENAWTRDGWIYEQRPAGRPEHGHNVRGVTLDPLMRSTAAEIPCVEVMMGTKVRDLSVDGGGRVDGVVDGGGSDAQIRLQPEA